MEPKPIYFDKESPEYNLGLYGKPERLAANRVILSMMSEYGLCNNARMQAHQVNVLIESLQAATGTFKEHITKIKPKDAYIKKSKASKLVTKLVRATGPTVLSEHTSGDSPIESTSQ
jgi:hypothetical protein